MNASRFPFPKPAPADATRRPCNPRISRRENYLGWACWFGVREREVGPGRVMTDKPLTLLLGFCQGRLAASKATVLPFFRELPSVIPHKGLPLLLRKCRALPRLA